MSRQLGLFYASHKRLVRWTAYAEVLVLFWAMVMFVATSGLDTNSWWLHIALLELSLFVLWVPVLVSEWLSRLMARRYQVKMAELRNQYGEQ